MQTRLGTTISAELVIDIPPIQYELMELYWRKKYSQKHHKIKAEPTTSSNEKQ